MSIDFMYDYLPSFYKKQFKDANGNSLLEPLMNVWEMLYGDAVYQAMQIRQLVNFEKCPLLIHETNITIDVTLANKYRNGYKIDSEIVWLDSIYLDAAFTSAIQVATVYYDSATETKYVIFQDAFQGFMQDCVFVKACYKDKQILNRVYGELLSYSVDILSDSVNGFVYNELIEVSLTDYLVSYNKYRTKLLALMYGLVMGPTTKVIDTAIEMWLGSVFSTVDGTIRDLETTSITIELDSDHSLLTIQTSTVNSTFNIGDHISKYQILEMPKHLMYDIYSNPARFTQRLLASPDGTSTNAAGGLISLLYIDTPNKEAYAYLKFDSGLDWDNPNLFWDMGNNSLIPVIAPGNIISLPEDGSLVTNFTGWTDLRFNNQKIYEMFRNVSVIELVNTFTYADIQYLVERLKPTYVKIFQYIAHGVTPPPVELPMNLLSNMTQGDIVDKNNVYFIDKYLNKVYKTDYLNTTPIEVGDYTGLGIVKSIAVSLTKIYILTVDDHLLSKPIGSGTWTNINVNDESGNAYYNVIALNDDRIYITRPNAVEDWTSGVAITVITATSWKMIKKDFNGNTLLALDNTYSDYIITVIQNGIVKYSQHIPTYAPSDSYNTSPYDLSFTQFTFPDGLHDVVYIYQMNTSGSRAFLRVVDLTDATENVNTSIILNANMPFTPASRDKSILVYATRGLSGLAVAPLYGGES